MRRNSVPDRLGVRDRAGLEVVGTHQTLAECLGVGGPDFSVVIDSQAGMGDPIWRVKQLRYFGE